MPVGNRVALLLGRINERLHPNCTYSADCSLVSSDPPPSGTSVPEPGSVQGNGEEQAFEMAALASALEAHLGWHTDIECAIAGNQLYLLQCRPITTLR